MSSIKRISDLILGHVNSMAGIKQLEDEGHDISGLLNAYQRGEEIRALHLVVGREHIGAVEDIHTNLPEATDVEFVFALAGYCANLPEMVEVDVNNVITNVVWKRHA